MPELEARGALRRLQKLVPIVALWQVIMIKEMRRRSWRYPGEKTRLDTPSQHEEV